MVPQQRRVVPATLWRDLSITTAEYALAATLLLTTVSAFAVATGDPETAAIVAGTGVLVLLTGIALVRTLDHAQDNGLPLLE